MNLKNQYILRVILGTWIPFFREPFQWEYLRGIWNNCLSKTRQIVSEFYIREVRKLMKLIHFFSCCFLQFQKHCLCLREREIKSLLRYPEVHC